MFINVHSIKSYFILLEARASNEALGPVSKPDLLLCVPFGQELDLDLS